MEDLIRLDSTSDIDDFDPLKSNGTYSSNTSAPLSLANPLYAYENNNIKPNGSLVKVSTPRDNVRKDQDLKLLHEYGLDFNSFPSVQNQQRRNVFDSTSTSKSQVNSKNQWTKFD